MVGLAQVELGVLGLELMLCRQDLVLDQRRVVPGVLAVDVDARGGALSSAVSFGVSGFSYNFLLHFELSH